MAVVAPKGPTRSERPRPVSPCPRPCPTRRRRLGLELIEAATKASHREVDRLITAGADVEVANHHGHTALSEAAIAGHTPICGQLLRALADPNSLAQDGRTPLHRAAFHGWITTVELLLNWGADPAVVAEGGITPASIARRADVRKMIEAMAPVQTREKKEERLKKLAERPALEEEEEETEGAKVPHINPGKSVEVVQKHGDLLFTLDAKEEPKKENKKPNEKSEPKTENQVFAPPQRPKLSKGDRERKYREALAELLNSDSSAADTDVVALSNAMPLSMAKIEVMGAGEERLNGIYTATFLARDRVEFSKEDDDQCQVYWCDYYAEWRMLIADYKMASTLYRHGYKPNLKADECHGVPEQGWQKWFGKVPEPLIMQLPSELILGPTQGPEPDQSEAEPVSDAVAPPQAKPPGTEQAAETVTKPTAAALEGPREESGKAAVAQRRAEFLEMHPRLKIIKTDDTGAARQAAADALRSLGQQPPSKMQVGLTSQGERVVETSEGLFGADEAAAQEADGEVEVSLGSLKSAEGVESHARSWLREDVGSAPAVPHRWPAVQAAKAVAADLYKDGRLADARQATTAAIGALEGFAAMVARIPLEARMKAAALTHNKKDVIGSGPQPSEDDAEDIGDGIDLETLPSDREIESMMGVLYSNRSLLILQEIQAADTEAMQFGVDAAWRLVVDDADRALGADASNFKASFRRARALFELGELNEALQDATSVVEHYSRSATTPNPEAAALRENILDTLKKENRKWGSGKPTRWNRGGVQALVTEVSSSSASDAMDSHQASAACKPTKSAEAKPLTGAAVAPRPAPAPAKAADVEKALLSTLKSDVQKQAAYMQEHLSGAALKKFFRRAPLGPDLLGVFIIALAKLVDSDAEGAMSRLEALASTPSAATHAAMLDASERSALKQLLARASPEQASVWALDEKPQAEDA